MPTFRIHAERIIDAKNEQTALDMFADNSADFAADADIEEVPENHAASQQKTKTIYHVFTDNKDEFFNSLEEAKNKFEEWKKEFQVARIYQEITDEHDELLSETCLDSVGAWPR